MTSSIIDFFAENNFSTYISSKLYRVTGEIGYIVHDIERDINGIWYRPIYVGL